MTFWNCSFPDFLYGLFCFTCTSLRSWLPDTYAVIHTSTKWVQSKCKMLLNQHGICSDLAGLTNGRCELGAAHTLEMRGRRTRGNVQSSTPNNFPVCFHQLPGVCAHLTGSGRRCALLDECPSAALKGAGAKHLGASTQHYLGWKLYLLLRGIAAIDILGLGQSFPIFAYFMRPLSHF